MSVVKSNSFRRAAEENHVTQPAVSHHISILEARLGVKLLERTSKKVYLTDAGKIFLPYAERIIRDYNEAANQVTSAAHKFNGQLRIASTYSIGLYYLQPISRQFLHKYPNVNIHVDYHHENDIYDLLLNRKADFGLMAFPGKKRGISRQIFSEDRMVLVQSAQNPVTTQGRISSRKLAGLPYVAFSDDTPTGQFIKRHLKRHSVEVLPVHEYDNIELLKQAVEVGMGCAFLPCIAVRKELEDKSFKMIKIKDLPEPARTMGILHATGRRFNLSHKTFYEMVVR